MAQQAASSPTKREGKATSSEADQKGGSADTVSVAKSPSAAAQASPKSTKEVTADQPTFASEAAAPPPPAPKTKRDESAKTAEAANKKEQQEAQRDVAAREREEEKTQSKDKAVSENREGLRSPGVASRRVEPLRAAAAKSAPANRSRADKDTNESETRSVAGRQFRRQNGVWVDTAYQSGRATIDVARSSEQYRALVADEPEIRKIADQLDGEVIVVWKGKAYKIH
jgi:hypothetical protein